MEFKHGDEVIINKNCNKCGNSCLGEKGELSVNVSAYPNRLIVMLPSRGEGRFCSRLTLDDIELNNDKTGDIF